MNLKKISLIIPCYNSALYLAETLDSVLNQSYLNWECLIVDDGSIDDTAKVAELYVQKDSRFIYLRKDNGGVSSARNLGLRNAIGDYIQFLDSDDLMGKEKLTLHVDFLITNPTVHIVYSGSRYFDTMKPERKKIFGRGNFLGTIEITMYDIDVLRSVLIRNPFITSAPLYRKNVFEIVGMYDESMRYLEDWDFQVRCASKNLVFHYTGYFPDTAIFVRLHETSLTTNRSALLLAKKEFYNKYRDMDTFNAFPKVNNSGLNKLFRLIAPPIFISLYHKIVKYLR